MMPDDMEVSYSNNPSQKKHESSSKPLVGEDEAGKVEISEEPGFNPTTMRKTWPGKKRLFLTFSVLFSFAFGLPFLIKSVEIYRSPLPFRDIDSLSTEFQSKPLLFPCHFQAVFIDFNSATHDSNHAEKLAVSIAAKMRRLAGPELGCGTCGNNFSVSVTIESDNNCAQNHIPASSCSWQCGSVKRSNFDANLHEDEHFDRLLLSALEDGKYCLNSGGNVYSAVVINRDEDVRAVVGKHRHGWVVGRVSEEDAVKRIAEMFVKIFINVGKVKGSFNGEFMPVGADGKIVLSFSLLNSDPRDWIYEWDFQKIDEMLLAPVVEALRPIANISIESQILYHTPKSFSTQWDKQRGSYLFKTKDLPFFVNSNEWHLDTSIAAGGRSKILHTVVYIPSANECPLLLQLPNGEISLTNGFISPMWGGVIVWNPSGCSKNLGEMQATRHMISFQDLQTVVEIFIGQLRQLFGLKSQGLYVGASGIFKFLASEKGFTEWELDALSRQHTCFNLQSCANTLESLSRLVQSLPRMIIMEEIGKEVKLSLKAAKFAQSNASQGIYGASAESSKQARSLAEDAFYHPSIMSVSHNSFEHYFAVYSPFFLPVAMHVILAAVREWKRYKQEKAKYLAWKAKVSVSD